MAERPLTGRQICAYHEAGHAVLALYFGHEIICVHIKPFSDERGDLGGACLRNPETTEKISRELMIGWGGQVAEDIAMGIKRTDEVDTARHDVIAMDELTVEAGWTLRDVPRLFELRESARELLSSPALWGAVETVAQELLQVRELTGHQLRDLVGDIREREGR